MDENMMNIENLVLAYAEKNLDALKEATDYQSLKRMVHEAKHWFEVEYAKIILNRKA